MIAPHHRTDDHRTVGQCDHRRLGLVEDVLPLLRSQGVEVLEESPALRMGATGYAASIYIRDPDGYVVENPSGKKIELPLFLIRGRLPGTLS